MGRIVSGLTLCAIFSAAVGCGVLSVEMRRDATVTPASVPKIAEPEPDIRRGLQQKSAPVDCDEVKCVALTFDDGPREDTARLLKMLDEYNAKATFFVVGKMVEEDPSMVKREVAAGHEIGNHSWSHANLTVMSDNAIRSELSRTQKAVEKAAGVSPTLFRPPYRFTNRRVAAVAKSFHLPQIFWQVDSEDWKDRNAGVVARRVLADTRPGAVVLMHDIHPTSINAVPKILSGLASRGFRFVTVSELFLGRKIKPGRQYDQR